MRSKLVVGLPVTKFVFIALSRSKLVVVALLVACVCSHAWADTARTASADAQGDKSQLTVSMRSGAYVRITTEAIPSGGQDAPSSFIESEDRPNLIHRVFVDAKNHFFFGYELLVETVAASRQFRVTVRPLSEEYLRQLGARPDFSNLKLHPSYNASAFSTEPQLVGDADTFALDVLRNPRTGAKIVDVIQVSLTDPSKQEAASDQPARDFALEDVMLKVTNCRLVIDGETVYRSPGGSMGGSLLWFALPGRGRFVFSLVPRPGYDFRKTAKVERDKISFEWGGERFEWVSSEPVVAVGGNWNLWVLHDPNYTFDLFDQSPPPPGKDDDGDKTFSEQQDEAVRQIKQEQTKTGFGARTDAPHHQQAKPARHTRVVIGAANSVEYLFPK